MDEVGTFGPSRARMGSIAQRAGVSSATLYRRYADKQALLQAAFVYEAERFTHAMRDVAARQPTYEDAIVECFAFALEWVRDRTILPRLLEAEPGVVAAQLTTGAGPLLDAVAHFIAEIDAGRGFIERGHWRRKGNRERLEIAERIFISLLLIPPRSFSIDSPRQLRDFARGHIVPILVGTG